MVRIGRHTKHQYDKNEKDCVCVVLLVVLVSMCCTSCLTVAPCQVVDSNECIVASGLTTASLQFAQQKLGRARPVLASKTTMDRLLSCFHVPSIKRVLVSNTEAQQVFFSAVPHYFNDANLVSNQSKQ